MPQKAHSGDGLLTNAQIADRLASLAQLLSTQKENPYKVKAYHRAAARIRTLGEPLSEMVSREEDLTQFPGIGEAIAGAIREIVQTGTLGRLESLRTGASPELAAISAHPRLDPKRVLRIFKKFGISTVPELREHLDSGAIENVLGLRMAQHVRQGITEAQSMILYRADELRGAVEEFLLERCRVTRAEPAGAYRRRQEVVDDLSFVVETTDFPALLARVERYGGNAPVVEREPDRAVFALSSGISLTLHHANAKNWGSVLVRATGSEEHLLQLGARGSIPPNAATEAGVYRRLKLSYIVPELREGKGEIDLAARGALPRLVTREDLRGDLHAHSTSSDGVDSIEAMAAAARECGYEYLGITDHSQSLRIAKGVSVEDLWAQIKYIDQLNSRLKGIRVLKSSEVDILADGTLDYPDDLLKELDYTVCSIHSRFGLNREQQTERVLRAMDNKYFTILGHATGRLLLKRPGYDLDMDRVIAQARATRCFFEINSSPDRLDLSAQNARAAASHGVKIAITTDAHSRREFGIVRCGMDQARRAGLEPASVLNTYPLKALLRLCKR